LNGENTDKILVEDGKKIEIKVQTNKDCDCCEVERECSSKSSSIWIQKSKQDKKTIILDQNEIKSKVRLAVEKVKRRRRGI
jgi:hypothetical protein